MTTVHHGPQKSVGVALLLTFLFGPLGMLYSTVVGGLVMLLISIPVSIVTFGIGWVVLLPLEMLWAALAARDSMPNSVSTSMSATNVGVDPRLATPATALHLPIPPAPLPAAPIPTEPVATAHHDDQSRYYPAASASTTDAGQYAPSRSFPLQTPDHAQPGSAVGSEVVRAAPAEEILDAEVVEEVRGAQWWDDAP
jgi:hypothetical protein